MGEVRDQAKRRQKVLEKQAQTCCDLVGNVQAFPTVSVTGRALYMVWGRGKG